MTTAINCPNCGVHISFGVTAKLPLAPVMRADYVVQFRGHKPFVHEKMTKEEIDKVTLGHEELDYVYEIPGTRYER